MTPLPAPPPPLTAVLEAVRAMDTKPVALPAPGVGTTIAQLTAAMASVVKSARRKDQHRIAEIARAITELSELVGADPSAVSADEVGEASNLLLRVLDRQRAFFSGPSAHTDMSRVDFASRATIERGSKALREAELEAHNEMVEQFYRLVGLAHSLDPASRKVVHTVGLSETAEDVFLRLRG